MVKRNFQLRNEIQLWSDSVIYYRDTMLVIMKHNDSPTNSADFEQMSWMIHKLISKLNKYNAHHVVVNYLTIKGVLVQYLVKPCEYIF